MRKMLFIGFVLTMISMITTGCSSCQSENKKQEKAKGLVVENTIATDKEYMNLHYGKDYVWYETIITMKDWLDENPTSSFVSVCNVFQAICDGQPKVVFFTYKDGVSTVDVKDDFWMEDLDMSKDPLLITYKEAFNRVIQTNFPKPHTKNCILRKPIGPKDCNPQWCFGNIDSQLWVDAVTGEVTDSDPSF